MGLGCESEPVVVHVCLYTNTAEMILNVLPFEDDQDDHQIHQPVHELSASCCSTFPEVMAGPLWPSTVILSAF